MATNDETTSPTTNSIEKWRCLDLASKCGVQDKTVDLAKKMYEWVKASV